MKFYKNSFKAAILFVILNSCAENKEFKSSIDKEVKEQFLTKNNLLSTTPPADKWWLEFGDSTLNQLIDLGLQNNCDIQIANQAIVTSRQLNNINITNLLPSGSVGVARQRFASPGFGPNGVHYDLFQSTFDATWELDFFGKNLDRYKAGKLRFLKEAQLYKANSLRIVSEISQNYFELKATEKQIENLQKISELRKQLTEIATTKESHGTSSKINIHKAEIDHDNANSALIDAQTNEKVLTYKLAVLIGAMPEKVLEILQQKNPQNIFDYYSGLVPIGLKSDILKRRPDIIAAEYEIDAAIFDKSAQFKEFLPSFNLTTRIGGGATDLGGMLKNGANVKDIRGGVSVPIFSVGQLMAEYKISKARTKIAVLNYEKTVLSAIEETESQLTRYINALQIENNSQHSLQANNNILRINQNKRRLGVISREEFLNSQITQLTNENFLAQKKSNSLVNLIALHKALGGGFEGFEMKFEKDRVLWISKDQSNKSLENEKN